MMCDKLDVTALPRILEMQNRVQNDCIETLNVLENRDDVETLKAQVKEKLIFDPSSNPANVALIHMAPSAVEGNGSLDKIGTCSMGVGSELVVNGHKSNTSSIHSEHNGREDNVYNGKSSVIDNDVEKGESTNGSNARHDRSQHYNHDHSGESVVSSSRVDRDASESEIPVCLTGLNQTQDVSVNVNTPDSNRLSRVLENIPLVYIPTTKQLGLMGDTSHLCQQSVKSDSGSIPSSSCKNAIDSVGVDEHKVYRHCESVSINEDEQDCGSACRQSDGVVAGVNQIRTELCSDSDQKIDKADAASFTSVSSISTGTEVSLSTASALEEAIDLKNVPVEGEDSEFMEINLHSRNSYEPTRSQVLEETLDERGARPKKKSLSGFLSR